MFAIKAIEARLSVADVQRSAAFYADILGFSVSTLWPDDSPQFAILLRDGLRLQLAAGGSQPGCTLCFDVSGAADLHSSIKHKIDVEWGPEVYFYHRREFGFRDPDGHLIIVSEATNDPVTDPD
jgi:catechol 2,3-dioxygenase-like lactoylglutathione lyase family enzyme